MVMATNLDIFSRRDWIETTVSGFPQATVRTGCWTYVLITDFGLLERINTRGVFLQGSTMHHVKLCLEKEARKSWMKNDNVKKWNAV